jgi:hypothetical protein
MPRFKFGMKRYSSYLGQCKKSRCTKRSFLAQRLFVCCCKDTQQAQKKYATLLQKLPCSKTRCDKQNFD